MIKEHDTYEKCIIIPIEKGEIFFVPVQLMIKKIVV